MKHVKSVNETAITLLATTSRQQIARYQSWDSCKKWSKNFHESTRRKRELIFKLTSHRVGCVSG